MGIRWKDYIVPTATLIVVALGGWLFYARPEWFHAGETPGGVLSVTLGNPLICLFLVIGGGMLFGRVNFFGVSFGNSGVIFTALLAGAMGYAVPEGVGGLGLALFVYCVGLTAGPTFFRNLARQGSRLTQVALVIVLTATVAGILGARLLGIPADFAAGVYAGAMTSTPALAAALEATGHSGNVSIGYGVAYVYGVAGVVLFVQVLPRVLGISVDAACRELAAGRGQGSGIERVVIEVTNPNLFGKRVSENAFLADQRAQISRVAHGERMVPVSPDTVFEPGTHVLVVAERDRLPAVVEFLGRVSDRKFTLDVENERMKIVATSPEVTGKTLRELNLRHRFGVTITRLERNLVTIVPNADTAVQYADVLHAVGEPDKLKAFARYAGHRSRALDETDIISLAIGIALGLFLGMVPIGLPGGGSISLGSAGGPLLVALVLAHFGRIGFLRGSMPRASRILLTEMGLVFFLAGAGVSAGARFFEALGTQGPGLLLMGFLVTTLPLFAGWLYGTRVLGISLPEVLGACCGGMTCTPALGALSAQTDSDIPAVAYAAVYPLGLVFVTFFAQLVARFAPAVM
ncbi:MAG: YidE/YbjL duplication [Candidatus Hydrogenedentes bacterium]|nr:YidE/YbjL duplication [Candidatus Hydrogenedentota bacterium]